MTSNIHELPIEQRLKMVEDIWDSIASDQSALPLTDEQKSELDKRLAAYQADGAPGQLSAEVIANFKQKFDA